MTLLAYHTPLPLSDPFSPHHHPTTDDSDSLDDQQEPHWTRSRYGHHTRSPILARRSKDPSHRRRQPVFCVSLPKIDFASRGIGAYRSLTEPALHLQNSIMATVDENTAVETAPPSPPELSYSKSSKDSDSSHRSDSGSESETTEKLSQLDEVHLQDDDSERNSVGDCNVKPESRPTLRRPPKRSTSGYEVRRHGIPPTTPGGRRENQYPGLHGALVNWTTKTGFSIPFTNREVTHIAINASVTTGAVSRPYQQVIMERSVFEHDWSRAEKAVM
ncbi:hypothetical protein KC317_g14802, partial [Hortaea werneckii]